MKSRGGGDIHRVVLLREKRKKNKGAVGKRRSKTGKKKLE